MSLTGLAAFKAKKQADADRAAARDRPKAEWFTNVFKSEEKGGIGEVTDIVFLQEFDDGAPGYREDRGKAVVVVEHQAPGKDGFKKRASCSLEEEGQCFADERHSQAYKEQEGYEGDWRQRTNLYINVATQVNGEWKPFVLTRNFNSSFMDDLMEIADPEEGEGTLMNKVYRLKKSGAGKQVVWKLKELADEVPDLSGLETFDLHETVLRKIPYANQPKWYLGDTPAATVVDVPTGAPATVADDEW